MRDRRARRHEAKQFDQLGTLSIQYRDHHRSLSSCEGRIIYIRRREVSRKLRAMQDTMPHEANAVELLELHHRQSPKWASKIL
jgi:hypothetical protein